MTCYIHSSCTRMLTSVSLDSFITLKLFCLFPVNRYVMGHIWACPPSEGDDYIFHCHPPDQKIPKPKRLQEWYRKMLDKAFAERIIHDYRVSWSFNSPASIVTSKVSVVSSAEAEILKCFRPYRTSSNRLQRIGWRVPMSCRISRATFGPTCWKRASRSWSKKRKRERRRRAQPPPR